VPGGGPFEFAKLKGSTLLGDAWAALLSLMLELGQGFRHCPCDHCTHPCCTTEGRQLPHRCLTFAAPSRARARPPHPRAPRRAARAPTRADQQAISAIGVHPPTRTRISHAVMTPRYLETPKPQPPIRPAARALLPGSKLCAGRDGPIPLGIAVRPQRPAAPRSAGRRFAPAGPMLRPELMGPCA
jgi:hypothetical protein